MPDDRRQEDGIIKELLMEVRDETKGITETVTAIRVEHAKDIGSIRGDIKALEAGKVPWSVVRIGALVSIGVGGIGAIVSFI